MFRNEIAVSKMREPHSYKFSELHFLNDWEAIVQLLGTYFSGHSIMLASFFGVLGSDFRESGFFSTQSGMIRERTQMGNFPSFLVNWRISE